MNKTASDRVESFEHAHLQPRNSQPAESLSVQLSRTSSHSEFAHDSFRRVDDVGRQCLRRGAGGRYRHGGENIPGRRYSRTGARLAWERCRRKYASCSRATSPRKLSEEQLAAVTAAAERGFRIDVFEAPALDGARAESRCRHGGQDRRRFSRAIWASAWWPPTSRRRRSARPTSTRS